MILNLFIIYYLIPYNSENMEGAEILGKTIKVNIAKPSKIANIQHGKAIWSAEDWLQSNMNENDDVQDSAVKTTM